MGNIVLLDELTINKIAAGEVVERPASVIKEMVENSIDAGANNINVEIKNGGISYIRITDNGKGIAKDDMEMAFERHATSKIRSASDLNEVTSMGFRGEALASIASIANVEMISKTRDSEVGNKIIVEAGKVLEFEETGCQIGTTITVQNLFFNTPVRYKFLKKDYTESGYIEEVITRLALINPYISFRLINSGKTIIQTSGNGKIQDVIYSIYGKDTANSILEVNYNYEDIHITGVVGKPEIARSNRTNQMFFVNKRYVKDKTLSGASENGFKGLLPIGKYGFLILNLEMNPASVDVNVHPAKLEVRFQEEGKVFKAVYNAIKDTLLKAELIANTEKTLDDLDKTQIEAHKKSSITDLFRKIKNEQKQEENQKENLIEQIYNQKENETAIPTDNNKQENQNEVVSNLKEPSKDTENSNSILGNKAKMDVFKELLAMQEKIKKETQANPNITTNINKIMENTQNLKNKYEDKKNQFNINQNYPNQFMEDDLETTKNAISYNEITNDFEENSEQLSKTIEKDNIEIPNEQNYSPIQQENYNENINEQSYDEPISKQENEEQANVNTEEEYNQLGQMWNKIVEENNNNNYISQEMENEEQHNQNTDIMIKEETALYNIETKSQQEEQVINKPEQEPQQEDTQQEPEEQNTQEERKFTAEEVQEMIDKLQNINNVEDSPEFADMYEKIFGKLPASVEEEKKEQEKKFNAYELIKDNNVSMFETLEEYKQPTYKIVGIAFNTYIIIEIEQELYIIDQHAAHERVMYEKVKKNYYSEEEKEAQMLLLPDIINLTYKEMDILKDNYRLFEKAGFVFEEFGDNAIKLTGVPNICLDLDTKELFLETLDEINQVARTAKQEIEERFIATVACKAAVKANMNLEEEEIDSLMDELLKLPNPFTCPHGRPTAIKMDKNDLEKKFARRK